MNFWSVYRIDFCIWILFFTVSGSKLMHWYRQTRSYSTAQHGRVSAVLPWQYSCSQILQKDHRDFQGSEWVEGHSVNLVNTCQAHILKKRGFSSYMMHGKNGEDCLHTACCTQEMADSTFCTTDVYL